MHLSGGEKQLVCLAGIMIMKPELLVLDEPCSMLDPVSSQRFINIIKKLHTDFGITVIMSEHGAEEIYPYADKIVFLENGRLVSLVSPEKTLSFLEGSKNPMLPAVPVSFRFKGREVKIKENTDEII